MDEKGEIIRLCQNHSEETRENLSKMNIQTSNGED
jgi:hypothetical protein